MSLANNLKKIAAEVNVGLRFFKCNVGLKSTFTGAALDRSKFMDVSLFVHPLNSFSLCKSKSEKFCFTLPQADLAIKKNIIEPDKTIKINFELPIRSSLDTSLDLPFYIEKEIKEPPGGRVINKRAINMIRVRRRKMRRHKYKKFLKRNKVAIATRKLRKKIEKESNFQLLLKDVLQEMETFSPEKYVNEKLEKVHWERPVTRVRGLLAPKWVIKQHLEEKERKRIISERINECLK